MDKPNLEPHMNNVSHRSGMPHSNHTVMHAPLWYPDTLLTDLYQTTLSSCMELGIFACNVTDTRYLSKDFLVKFIEHHRQPSSLWQFKSKEYTNRNSQNEAYEH
jgi:hypothetical protein